MQDLLAVRDLDFAYGRVDVLFGVSLHVAAGETVALLGTNGAGKSTLLRAITGLGKPKRGTVSLLGQDITGLPPDQIVERGVVLVPGGRGVFPDMTVAENLEVEAHTLRRDRGLVAKRRQRALDTFPRLAERLSTRAGALSGGEQQQLALAKAVMLDPALLCIDELSLGLAPVVVGALLETVREMNEAGAAILLVEQSLNVAAAVCDRAVFMEKGAVRFEGATADLLDRPDLARAVFFGEAPQVEGAAS